MRQQPSPPQKQYEQQYDQQQYDQQQYDQYYYDQQNQQQEPETEVEKVKELKTGDIDVMDLAPCCALFCCIFSCFLEFPDCCGSVCNCVVMCCDCKIMSCKPSKEAEALCKLLSCSWDFVPAKTCCQSRSQAFCLDSRISLPHSDDFPCLVTLCCITCCYNYKCTCGCGSDIRDIDEKANGASVKPKK